jgi:alanyl-tRNA synthetase
LNDPTGSKPLLVTMMNSNEIRQSFIDFFVERDHRLYPSSPLVPHGDATLLFTNAGMVQFKDFFLGLDKPSSKRAVTSQKCMRVSGKHNDLENVGPSPRHHTFFEMLGNFSFGDYFKEEAILFGWDLVTRVWNLPPERLTATVFEEDDEAAALWEKVSNLPAERILRCGAKENFWAMGETGPCGPCSEIFVDVQPELTAVEWEEGTESGRYLEIWNLVFMQYDRDESGKLVPLPNPSIDTGAGLERVAAVLQGVDSNYDTDLFRPLLEATVELAGVEYGRSAGTDVDFRVIADHLRAVAFLLADGVIPGNEGRGYVLRRILRRALRHGSRLGFEDPFLYRLLPVVTKVMGHQYRELAGAQKASEKTVLAEEEKFLSTVAIASGQVQEAIDRKRRSGEQILDGKAVFRFYDTFGLPLEMIREIAEEERFEIDESGFEAALEEQRSRSREATGEAVERLGAVRGALSQDGLELSKTEFEGYDQLALEPAHLLALARLEEGAFESTQILAAGEEGVAVLDRTTFYADAGGQLGDRGRLVWDGGNAAVIDTRKDTAQTTFHFVRVDRGELVCGSEVRTEVEESWRRPTQRHHTATHLLHLALRHVLGEGVRQAGSLVAPDRLRFDFTYGHPLTADEIRQIEDLVNRWILLARATTITQDRPFQQAVDDGAMALFGEKYGDRVRTVEVPDLILAANEEGIGGLRSLELCGGCHVGNTGEIGLFLITMERGVASGVRRIEALTGEAAQDYVRRRGALLDDIASELGVTAERAAAEINGWRAKTRDLEQQLEKLRLQIVSGTKSDQEVEVAGIKVLAREVPPAPVRELRNMADVLRHKLGSGVVVLGSRQGEKVNLVAAITTDLEDRVHAGRLAQKVALLVDGSGGGRSDFAQAGGKAPEKLSAALAAVPGLVEEEVTSSLGAK